ncbi:MAG: hypothetical protein Q9207_006086 [Kuettlingeria erythrocarpa]
MYFLKQLSVAVALGFALVDARAINLNRKTQKVGIRGLAKREDVDQDEEQTVAAARRCADALNGVRRKLRPGSATTPTPSTWANINSGATKNAADSGWELIGTNGLNSCSGVLIVGDKGYAVAHLVPIELADGGTPDPASAPAFHDTVVSQVEADFNNNRADLNNAVIGEQAELEASAARLGIPIGKNTYTVVPDDQLDSRDYIEKERGTNYVDRSDEDTPFVVVNGENPAPAQ